MNRGLVIVLAALFSVRASGQGCSDAGVCTAGPMGQLHLWQDSTADVVDYRHYAKVLYSYGVGEQDVIIMTVQPEMNIGLTRRFSVNLKLPYVTASGNLGENKGVGDLISTLSFAIIKKDESDLTATTGLRLPAGKAGPSSMNQMTFGADAKPLPMPYQTGLGTLDLLLGFQYRLNRWTGALAYQHVLEQDSYNGFMHAFWMDDPDALGYFESFALERADDAVVRLQYAYGCGRLALQPGLLAIYHMDEDSRLELAGDQIDLGMYELERKDVEGSEGLTLNITADLRYKLAEQWAMEAMFGAPVIVRDARPDGLTRHWVTGITLRYRF